MIAPPRQTPGAVKSRAPAARATPAPIFAVASGKGGVGKTWLSATLAAVYGRSGRRALLVDADLGLANVDVQLGVRPQADLAAVVRGWIDLEAAVTPVHGGPGRSGGFDLLPGHSGSGTLSAMRLEDVASLGQGVANLARCYERVILDLAAGVDAPVLQLARGADRTILVITEDPTSLTDAYAFTKLMRLNGGTFTPWIVVNMADKRVTGRRTYDQFAQVCERFLGFRPPLAGIVVRDPCVVDAIRAQTALPIRHPTSAALDDVIRIAEALSAT